MMLKSPLRYDWLQHAVVHLKPMKSDDFMDTKLQKTKFNLFFFLIRLDVNAAWDNSPCETFNSPVS